MFEKLTNRQTNILLLFGLVVVLIGIGALFSISSGHHGTMEDWNTKVVPLISAAEHQERRVNIDTITDIMGPPDQLVEDKRGYRGYFWEFGSACFIFRCRSVSVAADEYGEIGRVFVYRSVK